MIFISSHVPDPWLFPSLSIQAKNDHVPSQDRERMSRLSQLQTYIYVSKFLKDSELGRRVWYQQVFHPDSGGGMNRWFKRLGLVAACQCQLWKVEIVGERNCCRCFSKYSQDQGSCHEPYEKSTSGERMPARWDKMGDPSFHPQRDEKCLLRAFFNGRCLKGQKKGEAQPNLPRGFSLFRDPGSSLGTRSYRNGNHYRRWNMLSHKVGA